jgi:transcriptional antiterminator RfaH
MDLKQYQELQWFCIHTKPSREADAVAALKKLTPQTESNVGEIEIYFPKIRTRMSVGGKMRLVARPLFPRYFFSRFCWQQAARFISSRPQIIKIVQFGAMPSIVPSEIIEELSKWSLENEEEIFDPTSQLNPGQRVIIKGGPFKGMEADFISHLNDQKRVSLLLEYLQSHVRVIMDRSLLKPLI